jgi:hypothetical protein
MPTKRLSFFSDCVSWPEDQVDDLNAMIEAGKEITRATFLKSVDPEEMRRLEEQLGYERDPRKGLTMAKDFHVAYYRSTVRGCPAVYFVWSAIEQVFTDLACIYPPAAMGAATTYFYHVTTPLAWKQIQQDRGFRADDGVCGPGVYLWDSIDEAIMNQEDENPVIIRVEGKGPVSCEEALGRFPEEEGDQNYYEHVLVVPVKAGSIWRPRAMKLMENIGLSGALQKTFTIVEQATKEVPWGLRDIPEDHAIFRSVERVFDGPSHYNELGVGDKMTVRIRASGTTGIYSIWRTV